MAANSGINIRMLLREIHCPLPPEEVLARLAPHHPGVFFLDSARPDDGLGDCSFLGFDPFLTFTARDKVVTVTPRGQPAQALAGDPLALLRELLTRYRPPAPAPSPLPFTGGAVGGFSYEFGRSFEGIAPAAGDDWGLPDCSFGFYDAFLAFSAEPTKTWLVANPHNPARAESLLDRLQAILTGLMAGSQNLYSCGSELARDKQTPRASSLPQGQSGVLPATGDATPSSRCPCPDGTGESDAISQSLSQSSAAEPQSNLSPAAYFAAVRRIKDYIAAGDVYQVNLAQRFTCPQPAPAVELYRRLRARSPAPFASYFDFGEWQAVGSSPERFLRLRDRRIETRPIKGTRPRGATPAEDERLRAELLASEKDRAELLMIVDLERNDLGRVCEFGSVGVDHLYQLETHPTVFHLVAEVSGRLRSGLDIFDCLRATFPGGSITGAPKIRAMEIISELEPDRRQFYTGAFGYLGFDGNSDLNIAIRTIFCRDGRASYHVGSGIVWDSDPAAEYQETLDKGRAMRAALLNEPPMTPPAPFRQVMLNGRLLAAGDARISPLGDGFMFGCGVYDTIRIVQSRPVFFAEHCGRLANGIRTLDLQPALDPESLRARCATVIAANPGDDVLKIVLFADAAGPGELILTRRSRYTPENYRRGASVITVLTGAGPLAGLKSLNHLHHHQARRTAQSTGHDEAIHLDASGAVLEGAGSNVFLVRSGQVLTPPLAQGILPGVVRSLLLAQANLGVREANLTSEDLRQADEVFLTNSLMGVMPVARIDDHHFDLTNNPVTRHIQEVVRRLEAADLGEAHSA